MLGLIDKTGREVIPCKYEYSNYSEFEFSEGLAPAEFDSKCGYVDKTGHEVIPCKYYLAYSFCEGLAHVVKMVAEKKNLFDVFLKNYGSTRHLVYKVVKDTYGLSMSEAINLVNNAPCKLKEGIDKEEASSLIKALEKAGAEVEIKISDCASDTFIEMEKHGYVDKTGCEVIPCIYDDVRSFSEGLAAVERNGKWGYIDRTGREVIPFKYDDAKDFSEGIASVKFEDKYGFIDKSGREVIPFKYDGAYKFKEGLVNVCLDHKYGFIDKSGREVIPCKYQQSWLDTFEGGLFKVTAPKNGDRFCIHMNHGVVDTAGREVVPCIYDEVSLDNKDDGFIKLTLDDETIYVDLQGNRLK
jgi:ribosomal protein L7/L12